jgi:hypothetical protein
MTCPYCHREMRIHKQDPKRFVGHRKDCAVMKRDRARKGEIRAERLRGHYSGSDLRREVGQP